MRLTAVRLAVRDATRFDRSAVSPLAGVIAAIPVAAVFGLNVARSDPVAAATMGAGAMLVGIAWRVGGGRPPRALMVADALAMSLSTFVGAATGSTAGLHLAALVVLSLAAGLAVAVGRRGAVVGTQAIIAFVVFGRFAQPIPGALGLAGLVLAGGMAEVLFVSVVRWPLPLRVQRTAVAQAYRELAALATAPEGASGIPAGVALDEAEMTLSSTTLFGDRAVMRLLSLVDEGRRIRLELNAIRTMLRQLRGAPSAEAAQDQALHVEGWLEQMARGLDCAGTTVDGDEHAAVRLPSMAFGLSSAAEGLGRREAASVTDNAGAIQNHLTQRVAALAGQLRAVAALAPEAGERGGLIGRRPRRGAEPIGQRIRADLAQLRANMSLDSPAGRHAVRLAVVVVGTDLIAQHLPLQRSYWLVVGAATALRPEFGATLTRGTERILGTCAGVTIAGAIVVALHPSLDATLPIIALLAWAAYTLFPASFAVGFAFITAMIVFLLAVVAPSTLTTATDRLVDTLIGGAIGLAAYFVWPTWSRKPARQSLADVAGAQRRYIDAVLGATISGQRARESEMRPLARTARLMRTDAEATVARSLAEPATRRIDRNGSQATLTALRRIVEAAHVLRIDAQQEADRSPLPTLAPLGDGIDAAMRGVEATLRAGEEKIGDPPGLPPLRTLYERFGSSSAAAGASPILLTELDEIVDAVNTLGGVVGLREADPDQTRGAQL